MRNFSELIFYEYVGENSEIICKSTIPVSISVRNRGKNYEISARKREKFDIGGKNGKKYSFPVFPARNFYSRFFPLQCAINERDIYLK